MNVESREQLDLVIRCFETMHSWMKFVLDFETLAYDEYTYDAPLLDQNIDVLGVTYSSPDLSPVHGSRLIGFSQFVAPVKAEDDGTKSISDYIEAPSTHDTIAQL